MFPFMKKYRNSSAGKGEKPCSHQQETTTTTITVVNDQESKTAPRKLAVTSAAFKCAECKADERRHKIYRWKIVVALFPLQFLTAVDTTIVATALTTIASHFGELQNFNWIVTAYTLTLTAFIPTFGQLADIFGRHAALQTSMFFMLIGSVFCAAAPTWGMLLFGRALQGLSAAGISNLTKIVLSDKVPLAEQSKNSTILTFVSGISYSVGPVIGGSLAVANWRYCFVISIPIAFIAHILIFVLLRKELVRGSHRFGFAALATIDIGGTVLFIFGAGLLILGTTWGGASYHWSSAQVLATIIFGTILFVAFFVYENLLEPGRVLSRVFPRQVAMIPWALFERKDAFLLLIINSATGAALHSAFYFISIFWTLVQGYTPQKAGYQLLYYTPGIGVGVYSAMFLCNVFPRQTFYPLWLGSVIECIGFAFLTWSTSTRNGTLVSVMMAMAGAGTGLRLMSETLHAAGVWPRKIASIMSLMDFSLPFGGTLQIAIMSSVFYNKFASYLRDIHNNSTDKISASSIRRIQDLNALPREIQELVRECAARAIMWSFVSALPLMTLSVVAATCLGNVWIRPKGDVQSRGEVIDRSFLASLLTGKVKDLKRSVEVAELVQEELKPVPSRITEGELNPDVK